MSFPHKINELFFPYLTLGMFFFSVLQFSLINHITNALIHLSPPPNQPVYHNLGPQLKLELNWTQNKQNQY